MLKSTHLKLLVGFLACMATIANAGTTEGKVDQVYFHATGDAILFRMKSSDKNFTSCATTLRYGFNAGTSRGQALLSGLLAAKMADKTIRVVGANTCNVHHDSEDFKYYFIE